MNNRIANHPIANRKEISVYFDHKIYKGYEGDSLASILMAHHVKLVGRSFKYHRPRGMLSAGSEEPNAIVQHRQDARNEPNTRMTTLEAYDNLHSKSQNRFPNLRYDLWAINSYAASLLPSGFYYKTFMWPRRLWEPLYERVIRHAAGLGKASHQVDPDYYVHKNHFCDVLIVGGGVSGLVTANMLADSGLDITLLDEDFMIGGSQHYHNTLIDGIDGQLWLEQTYKKLQDMPNVTIQTRTTVTGYYDENFLVAAERVTDHLTDKELETSNAPRMRFWKIRAKKVVLATGMHERPLSFADNDRPGVMLASALGEYMKRYGVHLGDSIILTTNNDSIYETALQAHQHGTHVIVADCRPHLSECAKQAQDKGIAVHVNHVISGVEGKHGVEAAILHNLNDTQDAVHGGGVKIYCNYIGMSGGFTPAVHLYSQGRGKLYFDETMQAFFPKSIPQECMCVGFMAQQYNMADLIMDCQQKVNDIITSLQGNMHIMPALSVDDTLYSMQPHPLFVHPSTHEVGKGPRKFFIDFQNDVTAADVALAQREGYESVEHLKRYTTTGMGTDQGKTSNLNALTIMAKLKNVTIDKIGTTTFRPPYIPLTFGAIAGTNVGTSFIQERHTAMMEHHIKHKAVFEDVGDWKRPWYFPHDGEDMDQAVRRECKMVRQSCGMLDASTLGKIDIQGKDAVKLLNLIYCNKWDKLAINQCRYGLMLDENGMIFDDGVTTRLDEHHYHMTTTTGGAARVMNWIEEWLQTEYPSWEVYATSVTEQWSVASISGPNARNVLEKICDDDISASALPFMRMKNVTIAGAPARLFRISFTGESAFEINVPARYGAHVWQELVKAGANYDLCLYGTETMHVLRAEKGYIIAGQDTDGTLTPFDVGLGGMVSKQKEEFLGNRSLTRSDTIRNGRKQLVGFKPHNPNIVLKEGAHIVEHVKDKPPMDMLGHITSSYYSPNLGHSFGLAVIKNGHNLKGKTLYVPVMGGDVQSVTITDTVFYDKEGAKLHD